MASSSSAAEPPYRTDRVTLLACHKRKPGLTIETFRTHWLAHAKVFMSTSIAQRNLLKYEQLHPNAEAMKDLPLVLPYDGAVIFQARTYEDIFEIFRSSEYRDVVVPDEELFVDRASVALFPCDAVSVLSKL